MAPCTLNLKLHRHIEHDIPGGHLSVCAIRLILQHPHGLSTLSTMMTALMDSPQVNVSTLPLVDQLRRMLNADMQKQDTEKAKVMASIDRRKEAIKRLSKGPLADLLQGEINQREQMAAKMDEANAIRREALRMLEDQTYSADAQVSTGCFAFTVQL